MPRPRGTGSVYLQKGSSIWWIKYYRNGKPYRESTHTADEAKAKNVLKQRLAEITTGNFVGPRVERIRVDELADDFLRTTESMDAGLCPTQKRDGNFT